MVVSLPFQACSRIFEIRARDVTYPKRPLIDVALLLPCATARRAVHPIAEVAIATSSVATWTNARTSLFIYRNRPSTVSLDAIRYFEMSVSAGRMKLFSIEDFSQ